MATKKIHLTRAPYYLDYGEHRGFRYIQSDYPYAYGELLKQCPQLLANKWAIATVIDSIFLLPTEEDDEEDELDECYKEYCERPFKINALSDLPGAGDCGEFYLFDKEIEIAILHVLKDMQPFDEYRLNDMTYSNLEEHWDQLEQMQATGYVFFGRQATVIFKGDISIQFFLNSNFCKRIPMHRFEEEVMNRYRMRNPPMGDGKCAQENCKKRRIKLGIYCPKHHHQMLHGDVLLEELFDWPLPDVTGIEWTPSDKTNRVIVAFAIVLLVSFLVLAGCFVFTIFNHH